MNNDKHMGIGDWFYVILQNMLLGLKLVGLIEYSWVEVFIPTMVLVGLAILWGVVMVLVSNNNGGEQQ